MLKFLKSFFSSCPECPFKVGDKIKFVLNFPVYSFEIGKIYTTKSFYPSQNNHDWFVRVEEVGGSTLCSDFELVK